MLEGNARRTRIRCFTMTALDVWNFQRSSSSPRSYKTSPISSRSPEIAVASVTTT